MEGSSSQTFTKTFLVPSGLSGPFYVFVSADNGNALKETNRTNNVGVSISPTVIDLPQSGGTTGNYETTDLSVGSIIVPQSGAGGEKVSIAYIVSNTGSAASTGSWQDNVYLSSDAVWNVTDTLLGTVQHIGGVSANGSYSETLEAMLPGLQAGKYHVIVKSDVYNAMPEANEAAKTAASVDQIEISIPTLTVGTPVYGALANGEADYYQFEVGAGEVINLSLTGNVEGAVNDIYISYGTPPTIGQFDATSEVPLTQNPNIIIQNTQAGTYYVMVRQSAGGSEGYSLVANTVPYSIASVSPNLGSNVGTVTLTIDGAHFKANEEVSLIGEDGTVMKAMKVQWASSGEVWATFDLRGLEVGQYDVAIHDDKQSAILSDAYTVTNGPAGSLSVSISAPSGLRTHVDGESGLNGTENGIVTISYTNTGLTDVQAPILDLLATNANFIAGATGLVGTSEITIAGVSHDGPAGILQPGETESVSYTFHGYFGYAQFITMTLQLGVLQGSSVPLDWASV